MSNGLQLSAGVAPASNNRTLTMLSILLVVQVALAVVLKLCGSTYQPLEPTKPLLSVDPFKTVKLVIEERKADGKGTSKLVLQKDKQSAWVLPDCYDFRASEKSVTELLNELKEQKKGYPVTTSADAAMRFKVSADNYERAIHLYDDHQQELTLYLGTSPAFKSVYVKLPDSPEIYTASIPAEQVSGTASLWIDHNALDLMPPDIVSVDMGSFKIQKNGNNWTLTEQGKSESHELHEMTAYNLINAIAHLSVGSVLGTKDDPSYAQDKPVLVCKASLKKGNQISYVFSQPSDKAKSFYVLKISDKPWYLEADYYAVKPILALTADSLLKSEAAETARDQARMQKSEQAPHK